MPFQAGQSGNPNGRPKKNQAWTEILEKAGSATIEDANGRKVARKRLIAELAMQALTTGRVEFPDGHVIRADKFSDWTTVVEWIYNRIDGSTRQQLELSGNGDSPLVIKVEYGQRANSQSENTPQEAD